MAETIFALSSGAPPAAIGVVRISGPDAGAALIALAGRLPEPRYGAFARLRDANGAVIDEALVLWLPGPRTETGEDTVELQCHGGRAIIRAVEAALAKLPGLRPAGPGEFTRRAFRNGKIDLAQAEGLADLLAAETELQRQVAMAMAGGGLSRAAEAWRGEVLALSAMVEAVLDFAEDDGIAGLPADFTGRLQVLHADLADWLARPRAEAVREGFRVVIAGPPNAGKSTLFNALVEAEAAITAPIAGTTRDVLTRSVALAGVPMVFADTAGLRADAADPVEAIGIARAEGAIGQADLVLWLGHEGKGPAGAWEVEAQVDRAGHQPKAAPRHRISAVTGTGLDVLRSDLAATARAAMPRPGEAALNQRQHALLGEAAGALAATLDHADPLLMAEALRQARRAFDALTGRAATEDMLDTLFGRFCIGK